MAWRVVEAGGLVWNVSLAAERHANSDQWGLVLSFRSDGPSPKRFWHAYPIRASSKASIYLQADKISDHHLVEVVTNHLATG
jgi:hypothetical protein